MVLTGILFVQSPHTVSKNTDPTDDDHVSIQVMIVSHNKNKKRNCYNNYFGLKKSRKFPSQEYSGARSVKSVM